MYNLYMYINSFLWISILPCLHLRLNVCNVKDVREEYYLKSQVLLRWEYAVVQEY